MNFWFKWLPLSAAVLWIVTGCASHLTYSNGTMEASNYTISETLDGKGRIISRTYTPFVPDRWYSDALDKLGPMITQMAPFLEKILAYLQVAKVTPVVPTPAPAPTPAPTPTPPPVPTPTPQPTPTPPYPNPAPVASSVFTKAGNLMTLDLNTLPGTMRTAGFQGSDNALYYALAHIVAFRPDRDMPGDPDLVWLNQHRQEVWDWFVKELENLVAMMKADKNLYCIAITNDGKDRCGFRLGPPILEHLQANGLGSRASLGRVVPPEEY